MKDEHRLKGSKAFQRAFRSGGTYASKHLVLKVLPNEDSGDARRNKPMDAVKGGGNLPIRFGFAVGRRLGNAPQRNRWKRRMREILRKRVHCLRPGHDVIFVARHGALQCSYAELEEQCLILIRRASLWREDEGDHP